MEGGRGRGGGGGGGGEERERGEGVRGVGGGEGGRLIQARSLTLNWLGFVLLYIHVYSCFSFMGALV